MDKFQKGDLAYHKATRKRCVVSVIDNNGVTVTTQDDESKFYAPEELWTESEWRERNNSIYNPKQT